MSFILGDIHCVEAWVTNQNVGFKNDEDGKIFKKSTGKDR